MCNISSTHVFLAEYLPEQVTQPSDPWYGYLRGVHGEVTLPFNMSRLNFFYHNDAWWKMTRPGVDWPMASCKNPSPPVGTAGHPGYWMVTNLPKGRYAWNQQFEAVGHVCNTSYCNQWRRTNRNAAVTPALKVRDFFNVLMPNNDLTSRGAAIYDGCTSFLTEDSAWVEVTRAQYPICQEGMRGVGCWFFPARGSGVWINLGSSFRAENEHQINGYNKSSTFLSMWEDWLRDSSHKQKAGPLVDATDFGYMDVVDGNNFGLPQCYNNNGKTREAYVPRAKLMGFDSVQMDLKYDGKRGYEPPAASAHHPQLVVLTDTCTKSSRPLGPCTSLDLRAGPSADHLRACLCDDRREFHLTINCNHTYGHAGKAAWATGAPTDVSPPSTYVAERPNILIVLTDDQGYADLGCYGSTRHKTPRLDHLAKEGTRFTSFYAQFTCGPSRSALLTGRHPIRSKGFAMPASEITFGEMLQTVGYQTACIGKWDVSSRQPIIDRMPNAQGFDYYFGTLGANDNGLVTFHENNKKLYSTRDMGILTTLYTDKAIDYLKHRRDPDKPFALYLAHTMMHTVINASSRFRGKSAGNLYGDVVEEFDYETGRLLNTVDELGLRNNTLVIYTSDNGPWNQDKFTQTAKGHPVGSIFWGDAGPLRNGKGSPYEGGYRLPCIVRWPGKVPSGRSSDAIFATIDFMPTFASLAGYTVPRDRHIDGIDQTELLMGIWESGRDHFYFWKAGVRRGKWKYLKPNAFFHWNAKEDDRKPIPELYDLEKDVGERSNLASQFPHIVAELQDLMLSLERSDHLRPEENER